MRENYPAENKLAFRRIDYDASGGREIFLEFRSPDHTKLYSMLRLRMPSNGNLFSKWKLSFQNSALIREVHTYGKLVPLGKNEKNFPQHADLGKKLIAKVERIASQEFNCQKVTVIAEADSKEYYRKLDYKLHNT